MQTSFNVRSAIERHPYLAVGVAAMSGAAFAFAERSRSLLLRATAVAISGAVFSVLRQRATGGLEQWARSWLDQRDHRSAPIAKA